MRLLIIVLVLFLIAALVRHALQAFSARSGAPPHRGGDRSDAMVRCDICGLYIPSREAVRACGKTFCGDTHLQEFTRRQDG